MKRLIAVLLLVLGSLAVAQAQEFPAFPLPSGVSLFGEYNQLGSPKIVGGASALYPVLGQYGVYMTTTALFSPQLKTDPTSGKQFYAVTTAFRQGMHKDILDAGRFSFLLGGDLGPAIGNNATGLTVNFSSSVVLTTLYQLSPAWSLMLPVRGVYVNNVGWNPEIDFGVQLNLGYLSAKAKAAATAKAATKR